MKQLTVNSRIKLHKHESCFSSRRFRSGAGCMFWLRTLQVHPEGGVGSGGLAAQLIQTTGIRRGQQTRQGKQENDLKKIQRKK